MSAPDGSATGDAAGDDGAAGDALFDLGAQSERTALAWQRTGLSAVAVGALLLHTHPGHQLPGLLLLIVGALSAAVLAPARYRGILRAVRIRRSPVQPRVIVLLSILMGVVEVTAGLAVFLG